MLVTVERRVKVQVEVSDEFDDPHTICRLAVNKAELLSDDAWEDDGCGYQFFTDDGEELEP